jgi:hypothetical protein
MGGYLNIEGHGQEVILSGSFDAGWAVAVSCAGWMLLNQVCSADGHAFWSVPPGV